MSRRRVLLISEQGVVRSALARTLSTEGYEVEAVDPAGAEAAMRGDRFGAVVFDAEPLERDAPEVAQRLRRAEGDVRVVELLAGAQRLPLAEASEGRRTVIALPLNMEDLRFALRGSVSVGEQ